MYVLNTDRDRNRDFIFGGKEENKQIILFFILLDHITSNIKHLVSIPCIEWRSFRISLHHINMFNKHHVF